MNQLSTYTHLESLVLWESVLQEGVEPAAWQRISDRLLKHEFIKSGDSFDVKRLHSDALEKWFLTTLHQELLIEDHGVLNGEGATSPGGTKKRKLDGGSPSATLKDLAENLEKVPRIIDRLWERYKAHQIKEIRQKEEDYDQTQREIYVLEKNQAERSKRLARENGQAQAALSPKDIKPATPKLPSNTPIPPPTATPAHPPPIPSTQATPARGQAPSNSPVVQPKPPTPNPAAAVPAQHSSQTPSAVPSAPLRPPSLLQGQPANSTSSVLQPPNNSHQQPQRVLQAPQQQSLQHPAKVPISPRPNATTPVPASVDSSAAQPAGVPNAPSQGGLKWEKPYQPPGAVPHAQHPPRPVQSPAALRAATPQQYAQHQQQQGQYQQKSQAFTPGPQQTQSQQPPTPQSHPPPQPQTHQPTQQSPVLVAPQNAGQVVPQIPAATARGAGARSAASPQPLPQTKTPVPPPHRPIQPQQPQSAPQPQPRPIVSASPTPQGHNGLAAPPQRWPPGQLPPGQRVSPPTGAGAPSPQHAPKDHKSVAPSYGTQQPRPAIPEHVIRQAATPVARRVSAATAAAPTTPLQLGHPAVKGGLITSWTRSPTPSTPKPTESQTEVESPAWEPLSPPVPRPLTLPVPRKAPGWTTQSHFSAPPPPLQTPTAPPAPSSKLPLPAQSGRRTKRTSARKLRDAASAPMGEGRRRSDSVLSGTDELALDHPDTMPKVKDEASGHEEGDDTTADESVAHRNFATPGSVSRILKRKRQDTPLDPPGPPTQVLWTRGFHKVSYQALDQIASHRDGNMFLKAVRERDAPNYRQIVLQPQDMTAIRAAVKGGNQAASQAAANLPNGDPGTPGVWLPISEDLRPPKGIINSAQLERELCHMFCNAIMYNPDPNRGPGQAFMRRTQEEEDEVLGYHLDENAVVSNTQAMFIEVEKQMGDLRAAEKDRSGPAPSLTPRPGSVVTPADDTAEEEDELAADGDVTSGTTKRRRVKP